jgi:uncharacterized membrane protein
MSVLILGLVLFLGIHSTQIIAPGFRQQIIDRRGEKSWKLTYAAISLLGLVLIVWGYGMARQEPVMVYDPPVGLRHLTLLLMLPVFPLFAASHNPGFIKAKLQHPMLIGTMLWGVAHLIANGTLADVLLFGAILVWAAVDLISNFNRGPVQLGREPVLRKDISAVVAGLVIYAIFVFWLHELLFGVSPLGG